MDIKLKIPEELSEKILLNPESFKFAITTNHNINLLIDDQPSGYSWDIDKPHMLRGVNYVKCYKVDNNDVSIKMIKV